MRVKSYRVWLVTYNSRRNASKRKWLNLLFAQCVHAAVINVEGLNVNGLRATAATSTLEHEADIAKVGSAGACKDQHEPEL